ncbi:MAG: HAMP domain-containing histidine kinase [Lachnospiraceae bacterium]|nr:HAMP domain-containing histidine kinase [Lachnospiraceae bacterium]
MIQMEEEEILYIETIRDVTAIFEERDEQYRIYQWWMMGILLIESLCCYVMAMWLLRPLKHLTKTTGRIAEGNLSVRAQVTTKDEFGELSVSFNEMADSLEKQVQELEMAAKRQEDFIGSFAHELKTPLTSMIGYADMLRSQELKPEERFEAANYIFKEGKRLEALSFKLLELLVVQKEELEKKWVPIQWLSEDIEGILKPSLEKVGIHLNVMMEKARLFIEPDLMKTVLLNLLDNGRKAIEAKGELHLLGRKEEGGYAIYVKDSGKGMPKKEISRITEAFYMIDKSRAREQGGAGLGLSICAEIVKRHQGTLQFQSIEGQGTIVRIFLPKEAVK